jgi:hypothetical protein
VTVVTHTHIHTHANTWREESVKGSIIAARNEELKVRWSAFIYQAWFSFLAGAIPIIVSLVSFATLAAVNNTYHIPQHNQTCRHTLLF